MRMSEKLRQIKIHNDHELVFRFGKPTDVCLLFHRAHSVICARTVVYSPRFKTDPEAPWYDHGCKSFVGKFQESCPKARQWATEQYGITEWSNSPFGSAKVPTSVLKAAKEHLRTIKSGETP